MSPFSLVDTHIFPIWHIGLLLVFIGCIGLKNSGEDDYNIGRFIVPYIAGFVLAMGG